MGWEEGCEENADSSAVRGAAERPYKLGILIESDSEASIFASVSALAQQMGFPDEQNQRALADRVMQKVSTIEPYLVVFDNLNNAQTHFNSGHVW